MGIKELVAGGVVTLVIGGTAYTVNQTDVVNNFAKDTGLTQQEAEQYVDSVNEDELVAFDEIGEELIEDGNDFVSYAAEIDCIEFEYDWESLTLSCEEGKRQLEVFGSDEISLGRSYIVLASDSAGDSEITTTVEYLTKVNSDYQYEVIQNILDAALIDENTKTNSYNKATLEAALENN